MENTLQWLQNATNRLSDSLHLPRQSFTNEPQIKEMAETWMDEHDCHLSPMDSCDCSK